MPAGFEWRFLAREVQELPWVGASCSVSLHRRSCVWVGVKVDVMLGRGWLLLVFPLNPSHCFSQLSFREWLLLELEVHPEQDILSAAER